VGARNDFIAGAQNLLILSEAILFLHTSMTGQLSGVVQKLAYWGLGSAFPRVHTHETFCLHPRAPREGNPMGSQTLKRYLKDTDTFKGVGGKGTVRKTQLKHLVIY